MGGSLRCNIHGCKGEDVVNFIGEIDFICEHIAFIELVNAFFMQFIY